MLKPEMYKVLYAEFLEKAKPTWKYNFKSGSQSLWPWNLQRYDRQAEERSPGSQEKEFRQRPNAEKRQC